MACYAGIDLGTSSVKVLITDEDGKVLGLGQREYPLLTPQRGFVEQDPNIWWEMTVEAFLAAVAEGEADPKEIEAVGFSGQMHGLVAMDKDGLPVGNAIIWMDQRSVDQAEYISALGKRWVEEQLLNRPFPGALLPSLLWMKEKEGETYRKIKKVLLPKDYIRFRMTGILGTDPSDASATLAYSVKEGRWCTELLEALGIDAALFPPVTDSCHVVGEILPSVCQQLGLKEGTAAVTGGADAAMQLLGNGIIEEGMIACNIGTASQIVACTSTPFSPSDGGCQIWCHGMNGRWYMQGGSLNGGSTMSWLKNKILKDKGPFAALDEAAGEIPAGSDGVVFLPYLAGERTPYNDPAARGIYFGLGIDHCQAHLVRATMEGVVYNLKECAQQMEKMGIMGTQMISSGGGAKGRTWRQIQADVMNLPVYTTDSREEACLGAVITAMVGSGRYPSLHQACKEMVHRSSAPTLPNKENVEMYAQRQRVFKELYQQNKEIFRKK